MSHPAVPMHSPEHHAIVPAVIVAAIEFLDTRMGITLSGGDKTTCRYIGRNRECIREDSSHYDSSLKLQ